MRTRFAIVAILALMTALPFCSGMVVLPVSGIVRNDVSGLPIPDVAVTVEHIAYPNSNWHSLGEPEAYSTFSAVTGEDGTYRTPLRFQGFYRLGVSGIDVRVRGSKPGYVSAGMKFYEGWQRGERNIWLVHEPKLPHEIEFEREQASIGNLLEMPTPSFETGSGQAAYNEFQAARADLVERVSLVNFLKYAHRYGYVKDLAESDPDFEWLETICELTGDFYRELGGTGRSNAEAILRGTLAGLDTTSLLPRVRTGSDDCRG